jgi:hypothetical protein
MQRRRRQQRHRQQRPQTHHLWLLLLLLHRHHLKGCAHIVTLSKVVRSKFTRGILTVAEGVARRQQQQAGAMEPHQPDHRLDLLLHLTPCSHPNYRPHLWQPCVACASRGLDSVAACIVASDTWAKPQPQGTTIMETPRTHLTMAFHPQIQMHRRLGSGAWIPTNLRAKAAMLSSLLSFRINLSASGSILTEMA